MQNLRWILGRRLSRSLDFSFGFWCLWFRSCFTISFRTQQIGVVKALPQACLEDIWGSSVLTSLTFSTEAFDQHRCKNRSGADQEGPPSRLPSPSRHRPQAKTSLTNMDRLETNFFWVYLQKKPHAWLLDISILSIIHIRSSDGNRTIWLVVVAYQWELIEIPGAKRPFANDRWAQMATFHSQTRLEVLSVPLAAMHVANASVCKWWCLLWLQNSCNTKKVRCGSYAIELSLHVACWFVELL